MRATVTLPPDYAERVAARADTLRRVGRTTSGRRLTTHEAHARAEDSVYAEVRADHFKALGRAAFAAGINTPLADPTVYEAVKDLPVGTGAADIMRAWVSGWTAANLAAPLED